MAINTTGEACDYYYATFLRNYKNAYTSTSSAYPAVDSIHEGSNALDGEQYLPGRVMRCVLVILSTR
jgi:hypothetical protein